MLSRIQSEAYDSLNPPFALLLTTATDASLNDHASVAIAVPTANKAGNIEKSFIVYVVE